mmetsp:Transcript_37906/g.97042  ORF Transcript_37906/g.97042 Transcript_37906/m.97042 type:complete len:254 (-) Transcript_37906:772-1533(-)
MLPGAFGVNTVMPGKLDSIADLMCAFPAGPPTSRMAAQSVLQPHSRIFVLTIFTIVSSVGLKKDLMVSGDSSISSTSSAMLTFLLHSFCKTVGTSIIVPFLPAKALLLRSQSPIKLMYLIGAVSSNSLKTFIPTLFCTYFMNSWSMKVPPARSPVPVASSLSSPSLFCFLCTTMSTVPPPTSTTMYGLSMLLENASSSLRLAMDAASGSKTHRTSCGEPFDEFGPHTRPAICMASHMVALPLSFQIAGTVIHH